MVRRTEVPQAWPVDMMAVPMAARTAVPMGGPVAWAATVGRTAVLAAALAGPTWVLTAMPMVARTAVPMVARTAVPMVARTAVPMVVQTAVRMVVQMAVPMVALTVALVKPHR